MIIPEGLTQPHGDSELFFWFFPSLNPMARKEITIWLEWGPECSSLDGLLQENGPFLWQSGTYQPVRNMYSWTNLTNIVYIDQPVGTGLSPANSTVNNEVDISNQFNDFWHRFIDVFECKVIRFIWLVKATQECTFHTLPKALLNKMIQNTLI